MARIDIPEGERPEIERVWAMSPELGGAVANLSLAVYGKRLLPPRVREAARMKIAHINGCVVCMGWRIPELADHGVTEELYAHVDDPTNAEYSAAEGLAIEYAEKFALDHRSIDDAFFVRLKAQFTDEEILELTILIGDWMAFGRLTAVLDLDQACAWAPPPAVSATSS
jgi:alkylhydroperoxidase family enzyme